MLTDLAADDSGMYQCRVEMINGLIDTNKAIEVVQGVAVFVGGMCVVLLLSVQIK